MTPVVAETLLIALTTWPTRWLTVPTAESAPMSVPLIVIEPAATAVRSVIVAVAAAPSAVDVVTSPPSAATFASTLTATVIVSFAFAPTRKSTPVTAGW